MESALGVVSIALGAFAATEFIKKVLPWTFMGWVKMAIAWAATAGLTAALDAPAAVAVGAAGLSMLVHRIHRWLGYTADAASVEVMRASGRRPM